MTKFEKIKDICSVVFGASLLALMFSCLVFAIYIAIEDKAERDELINNSLGKEIVIQNDTLTIVKYNPGGFGHPGGFMLSNGVIIDKKLVERQTGQKEESK